MTSRTTQTATLCRWICLLLGAIALCFANGVTAHIAAAWIAPLLLLRFVMTSGPGVGYGLLVLAVTIASYVTLRGVIPVPQTEFLVTCAISGVLGALPYLGHRLLAHAVTAHAGNGLGFVQKQRAFATGGQLGHGIAGKQGGQSSCSGDRGETFGHDVLSFNFQW